MVTRLDRLARSTRDLLNVLATIAEKGGGFRSLADPWADTTTPHGRLMLTEGRARAMASGIKFGRKPKLTLHQVAEAIKRRDAGEAYRR
jgi:hypothetical protein